MSSAAHISLRAQFFAPLIGIVPLSGAPPMILILSSEDDFTCGAMVVALLPSLKSGKSDSTLSHVFPASVGITCFTRLTPFKK